MSIVISLVVAALLGIVISALSTKALLALVPRNQRRMAQAAAAVAVAAVATEVSVESVQAPAE